MPNRPPSVRPIHADLAKPRYHNPERRKVYNSKRWKALRRRVLSEQPWCAEPDCLRLSVDVDHIIGLREGGPPFDRDNVQGLCRPHHSAKTAREVGWSRTKG